MSEFVPIYKYIEKHGFSKQNVYRWIREQKFSKDEIDEEIITVKRIRIKLNAKPKFKKYE